MLRARWCRMSLHLALGLVAMLAAGSKVMAVDGPPAPRGASPGAAAGQEAWLEKLRVREAWEITRGDPGVLVGVIDNGFDFDHPDLKGRLVPGYYYAGGYHPESYDNLAHGTIVAGLIVARGETPGTPIGLAPGCRVVTASQGMIEHVLVKRQAEFFREHPGATHAAWQAQLLLHPFEFGKFARDWAGYQVAGAADAIRYLVDRGVRVINFSGGLRRRYCPSEAHWRRLQEAFDYAAEKGVVVVIAAGNSAERWEDYPGRPETVIIAGASRMDDTRWEEEIPHRGAKVRQGSCYGDRLTAVAPVEDLVVCVPHAPRFYDVDDGPMGPRKVEFEGPQDVLRIGATSSAAPIVSSLVALVRSARPDLDAEAVVELVALGCDDIGEPGRDPYTGHGRVDFGRTLRLALEREGPRRRGE